MNRCLVVAFSVLMGALAACSSTHTPKNVADSVPPALKPAPLEEEWAIDWWMPRHEEKLALRSTRPELVFMGDSITQGWEGKGAEAFDQTFGQWRTLNLGFSGDRTENVIWRLQHNEVTGIDPKLVVLMIGTNNTGHRMDPPDDIAAGVTNIIGELQTRLPNTNILLLAIFPRGETADDPKRVNNRAVNQRIRSLAERPGVFYANLNTVFIDGQGRLNSAIMPDLLHPNAEGYQRLADALKPLVDALMTKGTLPSKTR